MADECQCGEVIGRRGHCLLQSGIPAAVVRSESKCFTGSASIAVEHAIASDAAALSPSSTEVPLHRVHS